MPQLAPREHVGGEPRLHVVVGRSGGERHARSAGDETRDRLRHAACGEPIQHAGELVGDDEHGRLPRCGTGAGQGDRQAQSRPLAVGQLAKPPREQHRVGKPRAGQRGDRGGRRAPHQVDDRAIGWTERSHRDDARAAQAGSTCEGTQER